MEAIMLKNSDNFKKRLYLIALIFFLFGALLTGRLFFIQIVKHDVFKAQAERQYSGYKSEESIGVRGSIYFKENSGRLISAADTKNGFLVELVPVVIENPFSACEAIGKIINLDKEDCLVKAGKKDDPSEKVARKIDEDSARAIKELGIKGVRVFPEQWRFYPGGQLASQVLGFVGYSNNDIVGRYGAEKFYENVLRGKTEKAVVKNSFVSLFLEAGKSLLDTSEANGHDIVLTIEPNIQIFLEKILQQIMDAWHPKLAGGLIVNPKTGELLAMASKPDFDPNNYSKVKDISYFLNPNVSSLFEMGSVVKPLTLAAAMDAGKITKNTTYTDAGYVTRDGYKIENYDGVARGTVDMQAVLGQSLNTGAVFVMEQLGKEKFYEYFKKYGLGQKTGIDLPNETSGNLTNLNHNRDVNYATASFGQGISATPIEFAMAVSSLANGGLIVRPYVVSSTLIDGGKDIVTETFTAGRVLREETAKEMNGKVKIAKLNVDENHEIAEKYGIRSIPTFLVFKAGKLVDQFAGATSKQEFKNKVKEYA